MISKWESQKEKLLRFMRISPEKKMEWLQEMHDFLCKARTKKQKNMYRQLRESR